MFAGATQAGGLAVTLLALLQERGGSWIGWSGEHSSREAPYVREDGAIRYLTLDLARREFEGFYAEYANRTLWPLLHGRTDLMAFSGEALEAYLRVNERFAEVVAREAGPADTVWIHDYHLIPLASMLRARGVRCRIGFFLHTPLPAPRTLGMLPRHRGVLGLLAACDLVGLQTLGDATALRSYLAAELGAEVEGNEVRVRHAGRLEVREFPIGIDPGAMKTLSDEAEHGAETAELRASLGQSQLLIGVDRLDYSKGLPQRLRAFGHLLDHHPELAERATFLQITPESRREVSEYRTLSREVQRLVGDINGHHAGPAWTPVRYVNRGYPHDVLAGFYRLAHVGLVTPLRDGMNLVAKEFIACQCEDDPGVLVLSEFAGAARELGGSALLVNPHDIEACSRAMARALTMPREERRARHREAMRVLERGNIHAWSADFLAALAAQPLRDAPPAADARIAPLTPPGARRALRAEATPAVRGASLAS